MHETCNVQGRSVDRRGTYPTFASPPVHPGLSGSAMVYISKWEELSQALTRVMATGIGEDAAKRAICDAMADGNISARIRCPLEPEWMVHEDVFIPPRLNPDDLWWPLSRWNISSRPHRYELGLSLPDQLPLWKAEKIELRREHVTNALCTSIEATLVEPKATARDAASKRVASKRARRNPKIERAQRVIKELYPAGVPDQAELTNKELCHAVGQHFKNRSGNPGQRETQLLDDTILRAAGRRK